MAETPRAYRGCVERHLVRLQDLDAHHGPLQELMLLRPDRFLHDQDLDTTRRDFRDLLAAQATAYRERNGPAEWRYNLRLRRSGEPTDRRCHGIRTRTVDGRRQHR